MTKIRNAEHTNQGFESTINREIFEKIKVKNMLRIDDKQLLSDKNGTPSLLESNIMQKYNFIQERKIQLHIQKFYKYPCINFIALRFDLSIKEKIQIHDLFRLHNYTPIESLECISGFLKKGKNKIVSAYFSQYTLNGRALTDCLLLLCQKLYVVDKLNTDLGRNLLEIYSNEIYEQNKNIYKKSEDIQIMLNGLIDLSLKFTMNLCQNDMIALKKYFVDDMCHKVGTQDYNRELEYYFDKMRRDPLNINYDFIKIKKNNRREIDELLVTSSDIFYIGIHKIVFIKKEIMKIPIFGLDHKNLLKDSSTFNRLCAIHSLELGKKKLQTIRSESSDYVIVVFRTFVAAFEPIVLKKIVQNTVSNISNKKNFRLFRTVREFIKENLGMSAESENSWAQNSNSKNELTNSISCPDSKILDQKFISHHFSDINVSKLDNQRYQKILSNLNLATFVLNVRNLYIPSKHITKNSFIYVEGGTEIKILQIFSSQSNLILGTNASSRGSIMESFKTIMDDNLSHLIDCLRFLGGISTQICEKQFEENFQIRERKNLMELVKNPQKIDNFPIIKALNLRKDDTNEKEDYYDSIDYQIDSIDECCTDCEHEINYKLGIISNKMTIIRDYMYQEEEIRKQLVYSNRKSKKMLDFLFKLRNTYLASEYYKYQAFLNTLQKYKSFNPIYRGFIDKNFL